MRFDDMVLMAIARFRPGTGTLPVMTREEIEAAYNRAYLAQHEVDMAHEVACPCVCHGPGFSHVCAPTATNGPQTSYCICAGAGRLTLGAIVAADRARKGTSHAE